MVIVISASPNGDGLTAACAGAALSGLRAAGREAAHIDLCAMKLRGCEVCGNGWGTCRSEGACCLADGFAELLGRIAGCDSLILVTPVYWGQPSERMKSFMDRFRRCEAIKGEGGALAGKRVSLIAAAGGSGNGTLTCLSEMEAWARHLRAIPDERLGVTRFNRAMLLPAIERRFAEAADV